MNAAINQRTLAELDGFLKEQLEKDVVALVAERLGVPPEDALAIYYRSDIAGMIENGDYGIQYLSPEYLADEVLKAAPSNQPTEA